MTARIRRKIDRLTEEVRLLVEARERLEMMFKYPPSGCHVFNWRTWKTEQIGQTDYLLRLKREELQRLTGQLELVLV